MRLIRFFASAGRVPPGNGPDEKNECPACGQSRDFHDAEVHDGIIRSMRQSVRGSIVPAEDSWMREGAV